MGRLKNIYKDHIATDTKSLEEAYENGNTVIKKYFNGSESLFLEAYESYKNSQYEMSLLLGWALVEIIINKHWAENFIGKVKTNEKRRKERLEDHRNYSVAIKIEILYMNSILDLDIYNNLNCLRKTRNDLIHSGKLPDRENAGYILMAIKKLVKIFANIDMKFNNPGWSYTGDWTSVH